MFEEKYMLEKECIGEAMQQEDLEYIVENVNLEKYRDSTVFITGATGMIGSYLAKVLLCCNRKRKYNIHIIACIRDEKKALQQYGELLQREDLELYIGEAQQAITYENKVDYIFHTASVTASKVMVEHPVHTVETAYQGTRNVLEFAVRTKARGVVYVSSMEVYGIPDKGLESISEKDLGYIDLSSVRSSYSEGKRICECLCTAYAAEYKVPVKIARLAQTFGAGVLKGDNRVYSQFAKSVIEKKDIVLHSDGTSEGNYCYTRDAVTALLLLGNSGELGQAYNVVQEEAHMMIKDMAHMVAEKVAHGDIKVIFDIPESSLTYGYAPSVKMRLNGSKIRKLGWKPEIDLQTAYERMICDMRARTEYE